MREAAAKGDLEEMRSLAQQAEEHLREHGDVPAAVEVLKAEIAKAEGEGG
jgi:ATP/maltotriose-dependent transcriptional regulator MalT